MLLSYTSIVSHLRLEVNVCYYSPSMRKQIKPDHDIAPATVFVPQHQAADPIAPESYITVQSADTQEYMPAYIDQKALAQSEKEDAIHLEQRRNRAKRVVQFTGFEALALGIAIILVCVYGLGVMPAARYFAVVMFVGILLIYEAISLFNYRYSAYRIVRSAMLIATGSGFFSLLPSGMNSSLTGVIIGVVIIAFTAPTYLALLDEDVKALF